MFFTCLQYKSSENTVGKSEIAHNEQVLRAISPFPTMFSSRLENVPPIRSKLKLSSANSFSLEESKNYCLAKGYTQFVQ